MPGLGQGYSTGAIFHWGTFCLLSLTIMVSKEGIKERFIFILEYEAEKILHRYVLSRILKAIWKTRIESFFLVS